MNLKEKAVVVNGNMCLKADDGDVNVIIEGQEFVPDDKFDAAVKELESLMALMRCHYCLIPYTECQEIDEPPCCGQCKHIANIVYAFDIKDVFGRGKDA